MHQESTMHQLCMQEKNLMQHISGSMLLQLRDQITFGTRAWRFLGMDLTHVQIYATAICCYCCCCCCYCCKSIINVPQAVKNGIDRKVMYPITTCVCYQFVCNEYTGIYYSGTLIFQISTNVVRLYNETSHYIWFNLHSVSQL